MIRLLFAVALLATAETPEMVEFLRSAASALSEAHDDLGPKPFLDHFDHDMPGFATLQNEVEELVTRGEVGSAIQIVAETDDGDQRTLELDWVLQVEDRQPVRKVIKCTVEKRGKKWKFTSFEPIDFFKY